MLHNYKYLTGGSLIMISSIKKLVFAGALVLAPSMAAHAYIVAGPSALLQSSSGAYTWDGGSNVTPFRAALEDPANFGPGGVVEESIVTTNITPDAAGLSGVDGFISPWWLTGDSSPFHADIINFFLGGGDLWLMQDSGGRDGVGAALGVPTVGQTAITPVNGIAPLFDGPFGIANNVGQGGGEEGYLSTADVLGLGGSIIGTNTESQVIAAAWGAGQWAAGAGALVVVADIDMFTTQASFDPLDDNGIFALNAFAFLSTSTDPIDPPGQVPVPGTLLLLALGLGLVTRTARKLHA